MIKWPTGKRKDYKKLLDFCQNFESAILDDHLVAIDPGSKNLGWASFQRGKLESSGVVCADPKSPAHVRLRSMYDQLTYLFTPFPKLVAMEKIRGIGSSHVLVWSVGVLQTAIRSSIVVEVPINFWKVLALLDPEYKKSDEADAIKIGQVLVTFAQEIRDGKH